MHTCSTSHIQLQKEEPREIAVLPVGGDELLHADILDGGYPWYVLDSAPAVDDRCVPHDLCRAREFRRHAERCGARRVRGCSGRYLLEERARRTSSRVPRCTDHAQHVTSASIAHHRDNNGIAAMKWVDGGARAFHHTRSYVTCRQCVTSASIARHRGGIVALRWMAGGERGQAFIRYVPTAAGKAARPRVAHRAA